MTDVERSCRACQTPLRFVKTEEGKIIPLDKRAPVYEVVADLTGQVVARRAYSIYVSHFSTCPKANDFSASKKAGAP
jgi:hypothetical protein